MTRLKHNDISDIPSRLEAYDRQLKDLTGKTLKAVAAHAGGMEICGLDERIGAFPISVIPVNSGLGVITDFSQTVCEILRFMGFPATVSDHCDVWGISQAFEEQSRGIFMADDDRFVGINLHTRVVSDNSEATGRVFATALTHMAGQDPDLSALVMGCGPVGASAARTLLKSNIRVDLYDIRPDAARALKENLGKDFDPSRINTIHNLPAAMQCHSFILEATTSAESILPEYITGKTMVSAPGVPLGLGPAALEKIQGRLIHDKLELGVAAMAMDLIKGDTKGGGCG